MLALSTSWKSSMVNDGRRLLEALEPFDVEGVELEYRITEVMYRQMQADLRQSRFRVTSIHNYFPLPADYPRSMAGGDLFLLSHPDKEERLRAVRYAGRSIEHADDLEAKVVVLHCGRVEMDPEMDRLYQYLEEDAIRSEEAQAFIQRKLSEREYKKGKHWDALLWSLDRLARVAERYGVVLGIENRANYHELPGIEEFFSLFAEFDGGPLGYWHDAGHAHTNEVLTFYSQKQLLEAYGEKLVGVHFHDALAQNDHLPPGKGELDFSMIQSYLNSETLRVLEIKAGTPDDEVALGIEFLRKMDKS
jgi:sugar phosphate isomerase/epimerase